MVLVPIDSAVADCQEDTSDRPLTPAALRLRSFLTKVGSSSNVTKVSNVLQNCIYVAIYFALSNEGRCLQQIFPNADPEELPKSWEDVERQLFCLETVGNPFYKDSKESHAHYGRSCGRSFKEGEPIYRCLDCGYDETCVLCVHCFNLEDHIGHQVTVSVGSSSSSGICDCGDHEAWTRELHCKATSRTDATLKPLEGFDHQVASDVFKVLLDFIIQVMSHQDQTLPAVNNEYETSLRTDTKKQAIETMKRELDVDPFFEETDPNKPSGGDYLVVVWNDEFHNYDNAIFSIMHASMKTRVQSKKVAIEINDNGRAILLRKPEIDDDMIKCHLVILTNGLTSTIMRVREYFRQQMILTLLDCILEIQQSSNTAFQVKARQAFVEAVCLSFVPTYKPSFWSINQEKLSKEYNALMPDNGRLPTVEKCSTAKIFSECQMKYRPYTNDGDDEKKAAGSVEDKPSLTNSFNKVSQKLYTTPNNVRFNYLLFLDIRFWKSARMKLHNALLPPLVSEASSKLVASKEVLTNYNLFLKNIAEIDREPHLNILNECSVQLLTSPSTADMAIDTSLISNVLFSTIIWLEKRSIKLYGELNFNDIPASSDRAGNLRTTVHRALSDIATIYEKTSLRSNSGFENQFIMLCYIIRLFDGNWRLIRQTGIHVEIESFKFVEYFNYAYKILNIIDAFCSEKLDLNEFHFSVTLLVSILSKRERREIKVNQFDLVEFDVSHNYTAFLNPLSTILSQIVLRNSTSTQSLIEAFFVIEPYNKNKFLGVTDFSLRSIVLSAQVDSQYWIRNGTNVLSQSGIYKTKAMRTESFYQNDIHMVQISLLMTRDSEQVLLNIIKRFQLLDWFLGDENLHNTVYEEKVSTIVESLICFLYTLLTERSSFCTFINAEEKELYHYRQFFSYLLYHNPMTYADITTAIDDSKQEGSESSEITDKALEEVADYIAPRGLNDDGLYKLKHQYYKDIDPLSLSAQSRDYQDNVTVLLKMTNNSSIIEPKLLAVPEFRELGGFTRTKSFALLVFKLLQISVEDKNEFYLPQLLHLLHASLLDNENINGEHSFVDKFIDIPICQPLFSVLNCENFGQYTKKKADHLLAFFVKNNSTAVSESLEASFPEALVNDYKKKKGSSISKPEDAVENKRKMAKERQKRILAAMSKKQKLFIEQNDVAVEGENVKHDSSNVSEARQCVLCQRPETPNEVFGLPMLLGFSDVFRKINFGGDQNHLKRAFQSWEDDKITDKPTYVGQGYPLKNQNFTKRALTSCNHGMHLACLKEHLTAERSYSSTLNCPLCKTAYDVFIPVVTRKKTVDLSRLEISKSEKTYRERYYDLICDESDSSYMWQLRQCFTMCSQLELTENFKKPIEVFANTITQFEVSTRINGDSSYTEFLNQISEQSYKVLNGIFEAILLVPSSELHFIGQHSDFLSSFIFSFLQGKEASTNFKALATKRLKIKIVRILVTLMNSRVEKVFADFLSEYRADVVGAEQIEIFERVMLIVKHSLSHPIQESTLDNSVLLKLRSLLEVILLPDIRRLAILYKIIYPDFDLDFGGKLDKFNVILVSLGIPKFDELLKQCASLKLNQDFISTSIDYPGIIKLVDLPADLSYFSIDHLEAGSPGDYSTPFRPEKLVENTKNRIDYSICLVCGCKLFKIQDDLSSSPELTHHIKLRPSLCTKAAVNAFLLPNTNQIKIFSGDYRMTINAPYVDSHGQTGPKSVNSGHSPKLNIERYKHFNNMYLTGELTAFLSRSVPRRTNILEQQFLQFVQDATNELRAGVEPLGNDLAADLQANADDIPFWNDDTLLRLNRDEIDDDDEINEDDDFENSDGDEDDGIIRHDPDFEDDDFNDDDPVDGDLIDEDLIDEDLVDDDLVDEDLVDGDLVDGDLMNDGDDASVDTQTFRVNHQHWRPFADRSVFRRITDTESVDETGNTNPSDIESLEEVFYDANSGSQSGSIHENPPYHSD